MRVTTQDGQVISDKDITLLEQQTKNIEAISTLSSGDWKVIRELERKFLADTELNKEREALRASIAL